MILLSWSICCSYRLRIDHPHTLMLVTDLLWIILWIKICPNLPNCLISKNLIGIFRSLALLLCLSRTFFLWHKLQEVACQCALWLTTMHCFFVVEYKSTPRPCTSKEEHAFKEVVNLFKRAIISVFAWQHCVCLHVVAYPKRDVWCTTCII